MTIPQPPIPFSEGGPPQSKITPADDYRELIHEIRNLNQQVRLLHTVFVKRNVLYSLLAIQVVIILAVIGVLTGFVINEHNQENALVNKLIGTCQVRNQQTLGTNNLISTILHINQEQFNSIPDSQRTPFTKHLESEYVTALHKWQDSLPVPIDCLRYGLQ